MLLVSTIPIQLVEKLIARFNFPSSIPPRRAGRRKSQRDFIIQPSVDTMESWLRWVTNQNEINPIGVASEFSAMIQPRWG